jgi:hypothetical protein
MGAQGGAGSGGEARSGMLLPVSRSFVVQFSDDTAPPSARFLGRVEHIESGRSRRFASLDELVAFVSEVLAPE